VTSLLTDVARLPRPNVSRDELRRQFEETTPQGRVLQVAALHRSLNTLAEAEQLDGPLRRANRDLTTKHGRIDVLQHFAGKLETVEGYRQLERAADEARYDFGTVLFVGYDDVLDFKNIAGRDQDLIDIRALREARDETAP
jgi:hypothetical protein